jgi:predicted SAM-dependent methyltransferase
MSKYGTSMKRKLHIGGKQKLDGWEILNAVPAPCVDHVGNANNLSRFADNTFTEIYASHVVEHFDYKDELALTLKEWWRVLIPGGKLYVSVPDLDTLAVLSLQKDRLNIDERFFVMRMIFGGHVDKYDYHVVGLNQDFLTSYLKIAGYINILRVKEFGLFNDTSNMQYKGVAISLNMTAEKPVVCMLKNEVSHKKK